MIVGYAQNGDGRKAIDLFEQMMRVKVEPDSTMFVALLNACSHAGLVNEALQYYEEQYQILIEVDTLDCAGMLEEAENLIGTKENQIL